MVVCWKCIEPRCITCDPYSPDDDCRDTSIYVTAEMTAKSLRDVPEVGS